MDAADDDQRVRPENAHYDLSTKLVQIVRSTNGVILRQDMIEPRFVFDDIVHAWSIFQRPFHVCHQPGEGGSPAFATLEHFLGQRQHSVLIEVPVSQVCVFPTSDLELPLSFCIFDVDSRLGQAAPMLRPVRILYHVKRPIAVVESLFNEGKRQACRTVR